MADDAQEQDSRWTPLVGAMRGAEGAGYREEVRQALADLLKPARKKRGIPLGVAAAVAGMRRQELWECEGGHRGFGAVEAMALAAFYGVSLDGLALHKAMEETGTGADARHLDAGQVTG